MGKMNYTDPFEFTNLYLQMIQGSQGPYLNPVEILVSMHWRDIKGIEDFADHHMFPQYEDMPKCRIILDRTNSTSCYIALIPYRRLVTEWRKYIKWESNQSLLTKLN